MAWGQRVPKLVPPLLREDDDWISRSRAAAAVSSGGCCARYCSALFLSGLLPFFGGGRSLISVSYTHLDVYKRQLFMSFSEPSAEAKGSEKPGPKPPNFVWFTLVSRPICQFDTSSNLGQRSAWSNAHAHLPRG